MKRRRNHSNLIRASMNRMPVLSGCLIAAILLLCSMSCQQERVEYHRRPDFFKKAALGELPDEVVLEDGTVVKYRSTQQQSTFGRGGPDQSKPFQIREETEDGKVILRAMLPEHVIMNALVCVREEEYELLFDQLLGRETRMSYEESEQGLEEFSGFFRRHRHDLAATLTRMLAGIPSEEVEIKNVGDGRIRCKLRPQIADGFKFKIVDLIKEDGNLKLLMIR